MNVTIRQGFLACLSTYISISCNIYAQNNLDFIDAGNAQAASEFLTDRWVDLLITTPSVGISSSGEGSAGEHLTAQAFTPDCSFATGRTTGHLYSRGTSEAYWEVVCTEPHFTHLWGLSNGNLLGYTENPDNTEPRLYVSTDSGRTFTLVIDHFAGTGPVRFSEPGYFSMWAIGEGRNGAVLAVEYGNRIQPGDPPARGNLIFYSADYGQTWTVIWDQRIMLPNYWDQYHHHHAAAYIPALDLFVVSCGDLTYRNRTLTIRGDGTDVQTLVDRDTALLQPTFFLPLNDESAEEILFGSDSVWHVGILNARTGQFHSVFDEFDKRALRNYVWRMWEHDGLYYAGQWNNAPVGDAYAPYVWESAILVAQHPHGPWSVYDRPISAKGIYKYAGFSNQKMVLSVVGNGPTRNYYLNPAEVCEVKGTIVEPQRRNLLRPSDYSTTSAWQMQNGFIAPAAGAGVQGGDCLRWTTWGGYVDARLTFPGIEVPPEHAWQLSFWVKSDCGIKVRIYPILDGCKLEETSLPITEGFPAGHWKRVVLPVVNPPAIQPGNPEERRRFGLGMLLQGQDNRWSRTFLVDQLQIERAPATSTLYTSAFRPAQRLTKRHAVGGFWSDLFYFAPAVGEHSLSYDMFSLPDGARPIIRTYRSGDAVAQLQWDFGCRGTIAALSSQGATATIVSASPIFTGDMRDEILTCQCVEAPSGAITFRRYRILNCPSEYQARVRDPNQELTGAGPVYCGTVFSVRRPRFVLKLRNGEHEEFLFSDRAPMLRMSPVGLALCIGDEQGAFVSAYLANGMGVQRFWSQAGRTRSLYEYPGLHQGELVIECGDPDNAPEDGYPGAYVLPGIRGAMDSVAVDRAFNDLSWCDGDPGGLLGDLDADGDVDLDDLARLLSNYGMTAGAAYEDGDLDGDGDIDLCDLAALLTNYGRTRGAMI